MERSGTMTYQFAAVLLSFVLLLSCSRNAENPPAEQETLAIAEEQSTRLPLRVNIDYLRLREVPGESGSVLFTFNQGDILYDLGEASSFTTRIKLRGIEFNEPWILVEDDKGNKGWVYAGGLDFELQNQSATARRLMQYRLQAVFGEALADSIRNYREAYRTAADSRTFAKAYQAGMKLRDTLNHILVNKVEIQDYNRLPDLFWLREALPGFIPQLVAEGTLYQLFANYKDMAARAARTSGQEDDRFMALCFKIFPQDSIEYYFPGWFLQTWDYGGHSELGKGVHFDILDRMNKILAEDQLFEAEIEGFKTRLLDDITNTENTYWYLKDAILKELNQIQNASFGLLDDRDKTALEVRIRQFENPEANRIKLNMRSGVHDD
jgi:hypothetical protein